VPLSLQAEIIPVEPDADNAAVGKNAESFCPFSYAQIVIMHLMVSLKLNRLNVAKH